MEGDETTSCYLKKYKCFRCNKDIHVGIDRYKMIALEIPYMNLFFHRDECFVSYNEAEQFIKENSNKLYKYAQL